MGAGKLVAGVTAVGVAAWGLANPEKVQCAIDVFEGGLPAVIRCMELGGAAAEGTIELPTKIREDVKSVVSVQVLGTVAMQLGGGRAVLDVDNNGWTGIIDGVPGVTDSTWFWNRDGDKTVNVVYNPCFGMKTEKDRQPTEDMKKKGEYDPPVSDIGYFIDMLPEGKVAVTIKPGPMQACYMRVPNTVEQGGVENNMLWTDQNGSRFLRTNGNPTSIRVPMQVASAWVNSLVIKAAEVQACPTEAMRNGGMNDSSIQEAVGDAALGAILRKYKNDPAMRTAIQTAHDEGRYTVELSPDSARQPAAIAALDKMIAELRTKNIMEGLEDDSNSPYNFEAFIREVKKPQIVSCGTGKINGGS